MNLFWGNNYSNQQSFILDEDVFQLIRKTGKIEKNRMITLFKEKTRYVLCLQEKPELRSYLERKWDVCFVRLYDFRYISLPFLLDKHKNLKWARQTILFVRNTILLKQQNPRISVYQNSVDEQNHYTRAELLEK